MAKQAELTREEIMHRTDPRWNDVPLPCQHCTHLVSLGNQFNKEGWTCSAYPSQIPYSVLTLRTAHTEVDTIQEGTDVYDPKIYTEEGTGRKWHYNADASWEYMDGEGGE